MNRIDALRAASTKNGGNHHGCGPSCRLTYVNWGAAMESLGRLEKVGNVGDAVAHYGNATGPIATIFSWI
jgi:hypothetical protein